MQARSSTYTYEAIRPLKTQASKRRNRLEATNTLSGSERASEHLHMAKGNPSSSTHDQRQSAV
jgi:hypothetical protein